MVTEEPHDKPERRPIAVLHRERGSRASLAALLAGRCPRCHHGRIFTSLWHMAPQCEVCALRFEREPGYFTGAMYVSYVIALPIFVALLGLVWLVASTLSFERAVGITVVLFLPFVPLVFRGSRILWIHFDRTIDAEE